MTEDAPCSLRTLRRNPAVRAGEVVVRLGLACVALGLFVLLLRVAPIIVVVVSVKVIVVIVVIIGGYNEGILPTLQFPRAALFAAVEDDLDPALVIELAVPFFHQLTGDLDVGGRAAASSPCGLGHGEKLGPRFVEILGGNG